MKKTLLTLLSLMLFATPALAATIVSEYNLELDQYEVKNLAPVMITSTSDGDITAEHGINIVMGSLDQLLFDERDLSFVGSAINNGRVNLNVEGEYASDYRSVHIPVMDDFEAGDWLQVQGLAFRAYDDSTGNEYLGLDLDGDLEPEVSDPSRYKVTTNERNDITAPYPVTGVAYVKNTDGSVSFTWKRPPDYDYYRTIVNRTRVKNGVTFENTAYYDTNESFKDTDLKDTSLATYEFMAVDTNLNWSEPVTVVIDFTEPVEESEEELVPVEPEEPAEEPATPETEVQELSRLLNYYNVRYSIKCMPSGVAVAENNSACLWARIDLIYAQEKTDEVKVAGLGLTERDLELMETRRRWPEQRYEENCTLADAPASYCPALGKALDRISFFLD